MSTLERWGYPEAGRLGRGWHQGQKAKLWGDVVLEAPGRHPQDQCSCRTRCSWRLLGLASGGLREMGSGCGCPPGQGGGPFPAWLCWGVHGGAFPFVGIRFLMHRMRGPGCRAARAFPDPASASVLEFSCDSPLSFPVKSLFHLPDLRVRRAGCGGCAFHLDLVGILSLPLPTPMVISGPSVFLSLSLSGSRNDRIRQEGWC